ncbi:MAG: sugar ABC transporter ATP-binding protein [Sphaerochaeta sp.]|nr:sugar ABC transporter ATP-binding protein [Sphaerochaeta sp.]
MTILQTKGLTKRFQGVVALSDVDFELEKGEIHAIVGENGAGKSTFVKLLAGIHNPTEGTYYIDGKETLFSSPKEAMPYIGLVHQDRELIPHFNGYRNLFLGTEISKIGFLDNVSMKEQCNIIREKFNLNMDLDKPVMELGTGQQEMMTILKILFRHPPILIFDEPTASLSMQESEILFSLIRDLKTQGFSIIYISHRLPEVLSLADRISVLKNGKKVITLDNKGITEQQLISYMISKNLENQYPKVEKEIKETIFEVKDYSYEKENLHKLNYYVRSGEIVGFAGLVGAGRTELNLSIFSGQGRNTQSIFMEGKPFCSSSPKESINNGLVMIPEDRRGQGVIVGMSIKENVILPNMKALTNKGFINKKKIDSFSKDIVSRLSIAASSDEQQVRTLSGGNQQKVAIGKWLDIGAKVWIFDEPTQGIDVETKSEIYKMLGNFAKNGAGVIFISSDLRELTEIADRIYVMCEHKITGEFSSPFVENDILTNMIGVEK